MSEPRIDEIVRELRGTAPSAPEHLRERIRTLPEPDASRRFPIGLRPALAGAAALAVTLGVGAAIVNGFTGESQSPDRGALVEAQDRAGSARAPVAKPLTAGQTREGAAALPPARRLQDYDAFLRVRVRSSDELSDAIKRAIRDTRRLGGYVVSARYSQAAQGDGSLVVRVPIGRVQDAIASFSILGTIVEQRISLQDIQPRADRLAKSIAAKNARIAELEAKGGRTGLTPREQDELAATKADLTRLTQRRAAVVRQGSYARLSLGLTTRKAAEPAKKEDQGALGTFLDDAGTIFAMEAVAVLYAVVVVGPFALLAALALLGERARRRRASNDLLERVGQTG
jgi:hypothetical protein